MLGRPESRLWKPTNNSRARPWLRARVSERIGKSMIDARLLGARLWLPASEGVTPQWLERTLRCHQAVHALQPGSAQPAASDPPWRPVGRIAINVEPHPAGFDPAPAHS